MSTIEQSLRALRELIEEYKAGPCQLVAVANRLEIILGLPHTFVDRMDGTDTCQACCRDIRSGVHFPKEPPCPPK